MTITDAAAIVIREIPKKGSPMHKAVMLQREQLLPLYASQEFITFVSAMHVSIKEAFAKDTEESDKLWELAGFLLSTMAMAMVLAGAAGTPTTLDEAEEILKQEAAPVIPGDGTVH